MTLPDELVEAARIDGASPCVSFATSFFRCPKLIWRRCFDHLYLRLEPVFVAVVDYYRLDLGTTVAGIKGMIATGEGTRNGTR